MEHADFVAAIKAAMEMWQADRALDAASGLDQLLPAVEAARAVSITDWHMQQTLGLRAQMLEHADPPVRLAAIERLVEFNDKGMLYWVGSAVDSCASLALELHASGNVGAGVAALRRAELLAHLLESLGIQTDWNGWPLQRARDVLATGAPAP